jgi:hypothetical protein
MNEQQTTTDEFDQKEQVATPDKAIFIRFATLTEQLLESKQLLQKLLLKK